MEPGRPAEVWVDTIWISPGTPSSSRSYFPAQRSCTAGCSRDSCSVGSPGDTDLDGWARRVTEARFESSGALPKAWRSLDWRSRRQSAYGARTSVRGTSFEMKERMHHVAVLVLCLNSINAHQLNQHASSVFCSVSVGLRRSCGWCWGWTCSHNPMVGRRNGWGRAHSKIGSWKSPWVYQSKCLINRVVVDVPTEWYQARSSPR